MEPYPSSPSTPPPSPISESRSVRFSAEHLSNSDQILLFLKLASHVENSTKEVNANYPTPVTEQIVRINHVIKKGLTKLQNIIIQSSAK